MTIFPKIYKSLSRILILLLFFFINFFGYSNNSLVPVDTLMQQSTLDVASIHVNSVKQERLFQKAKANYDKALLEKDTILVVKNLITLSDFDRFRGDYDMAFDKLWEALLLSKQKKMKVEYSLVHRNIGILYDIYNKDSLALSFLSKSIFLSKSLIKTDQLNLNQIASSYFSMAMYWRKRKKYDLAIKYLDSTKGVFNGTKIQPFVLAERGYCFLKKSNLIEAEGFLFRSKFHFIKRKLPYQAAVFLFIGDLKVARKQTDSALFYYQKSLNFINKIKVHMELKPEVLEKMAQVYLKAGKSDMAYKCMLESKNSFESLFSITSRSNERLFEMKNKYKENFIKQERLIKEQSDLIDQKNSERIWFFVISSLFVLVILGFYIVSNQRNKIKKLDLIQQLETKKNTIVLSTKNKELTSYSLQLIEKEQTIKELLEAIKAELPQRYMVLKNKYNYTSKSFWDDFNRRFVEINNDFYQTLNAKHTNLTPTEQKHCALIRLNLDSLEMASLLNISIQSVHTSRYRIRKKIGIEHNDSLEAYIRDL